MDRTLPKKIAMVWRADGRAPTTPTKYEQRLKPVAEALRVAGFQPAPMGFLEEEAEAFRDQLLTCAGALVWVNPIADGRDRRILDPILSEAVARGVWISARPDVIAKMATKEVLYRTRELGWGSDTTLYEHVDAFAEQFLENIARGARVLKPLRGNDGCGVMKISGGPAEFHLQTTAGDEVQSVTWSALVEHVGEMLRSTTAVIDQDCHDARRGLVRCYMSFDRVIGFCAQTPKSATQSFGMNASKEMYVSDDARFAELRDCMDKDWVPGLKRLTNLETAALPALWDADFLYRRVRDAPGSRYALCEINASCVSPFPDSAPIEIAHGLKKWVGL